MREAIASTPLYNIIIIFMVIVFAFILGIMAYYKAFKVNKSILAVVEKYEGYNDYSIAEIDTTLKGIGYGVYDNITCPAKEGILLSNPSDYKYCIYLTTSDNADGTNRYYSYGVVTYITLDFPFINVFLKMPVYSKSNRIYRFS